MRNTYHVTKINPFQTKSILSIHTINQVHSSITFTNVKRKIIPSLLILPVELVYRILDHLDDWTMSYATKNICTHINTIVDIYHRHQVNFSFFSYLVFKSCKTSFVDSQIFSRLFTVRNRHLPHLICKKIP